MVSRKILPSPQGWVDAFGYVLHQKEAMRIKIAYINAFNWMYAMLQVGHRQFEEERNAVMLEYMKEKDVASMSGRLLNRWGKIKASATGENERLEQHGQTVIPGLTINGSTAKQPKASKWGNNTGSH